MDTKFKILIISEIILLAPLKITQELVQFSLKLYLWLFPVQLRFKNQTC